MYNKVILIIFFVLMHSLMVYSVHHNGKTFYNNKKTKIFDISHKYLPNLSKDELLLLYNDVIALGSPVIFGYDVFFEYLKYFPVIFIIRCFMNFVTILPKDKECKDEKFDLENFIKGHCYDKIFSGHFASILLLTFILYDKQIMTDQLSIILFLIFQGYIILATRTHYTIDVIVAIFVVALVYKFKLAIY